MATDKFTIGDVSVTPRGVLVIQLRNGELRLSRQDDGRLNFELKPRWHLSDFRYGHPGMSIGLVPDKEDQQRS